MSAWPQAARRVALAGSVAVILADSSVVTLALPEILRDFDASVVGVSWVLTAFNIALALAILPAARVARERPLAAWRAGMAAFALASAICALADTGATLIVARIAQGAGGAVAIAGAIEVLARLEGGHARAAALWGIAGTVGLAAGPALGGLLTELLGWRAIFAIQAPLPLLLLAAARVRLPAPRPGPAGRRDGAPEIALALLSAGLTGALFLLVVLLTEGWGLSPLAAAATVSAMPLAALLAGRLIAWAGPPRSAALAGAIAVSGGLAALGFLPGSSLALTLEPQALIGIGLALTLPTLTAVAVGGRDPGGTRAARTLAARHAGIVAGIVLIAPAISIQLDAQTLAARESATAILLDAPLEPAAKIDLGAALGERIEAADGGLPDVGAAFDELRAGSDPAERATLDDVEAAITDQIARAATHAFSIPFLIAAALSLLALPAILALRPGGRSG